MRHNQYWEWMYRNSKICACTERKELSFNFFIAGVGWKIWREEAELVEKLRGDLYYTILISDRVLYTSRLLYFRRGKEEREDGRKNERKEERTKGRKRIGSLI